MNLPSDSAARFARDQLAAGCDTMMGLLLGLLTSKGRIADEVHAIRKFGKSLRGGFALFHQEKSGGLAMQAIGRLLSGPRDAVTRRHTWHRIAWNKDPLAAAAIAGLLDLQAHCAKRRAPPETIEWCVERVMAARRGLLEASGSALTFTLASGLAKLEHKTLKRCHKLEHGRTGDFHQARKALKAWLGAIGFLPDGMITRDEKLTRLAEMLGEENDLATLTVWLKNHGFSAKFAPDLWKTLKSARRNVQQEVIRDAAQLTRPTSVCGLPPPAGRSQDG